MLRPESVNIVDLEYAEKIRDGDELRNINSYEYLLHIANKIVLIDRKNHADINTLNNTPEWFPPITTPEFFYRIEAYRCFHDLKKFFNDHKKDEKGNPIYDAHLAYGNVYTSFLEELENVLPEIEAHREQMFFQRLEYKKKISQSETSVGALQKKIEQLTAAINYYKDHPDDIQYDHRYVESNDKKFDQFFEKLDKEKSQMNTRLEKLNTDIATYQALRESIQTFLDNLDQIIDKVYANPNHGLERSAAMVTSVIKGVSQTSKNIEKVICNRLKGNSKSKSGKLLDTVNFHISYRDINKTTPQREGKLLQVGLNLISPSFKPIKKTSMPSIRNYDYMQAAKSAAAFFPIEYRMGTQAEYHRTDARNSPIFESWLRVQKRKRKANPKRPGQTRISHIYFNYLGLDRESYEGKREAGLTLQLHELEKFHDNVAVITLPADHGIMDRHFLEHHQKTMKIQDAFEKMLKIANGTSKEKVKDFYISDPIKKLLYGDGKPYDEANERTELTKLLTNSFQVLGFTFPPTTESETELSEAELQAIYFHFIKFELTDFIIKKLQPDSFNMSCKDGIDRAGISSAYYNLMKSIGAGLPLSEIEFIRALHGAPTMVKGRGMNHHSKLIWNAIDADVNANINNASVDMPAWSIKWRDENAPPHTKPYYIKELENFIETHKQQANEVTTVSLFKTNNVSTKESIETAIQMLALIKNPDTAIVDANAVLAFNDKDLIKLRADIEKDYIFDFAPYLQTNLTQSVSVHG